MIRINLAKSSNFMNAGGEKQANIFNADMNLKLDWSHLQKLSIILTFVAILVVYEKYNLFSLKKKLEASVSEVKKIQEELGSFGDVSSVIHELIKEKEKMSTRMEVVKTISRRRTSKTNTLLNIQKNAPEDLWLKEIVFEKDKILFSGYSRKVSSVQEIVKKMGEVDSVESAVNKDIKKVNNDSENETHEFTVELKLKE